MKLRIWPPPQWQSGPLIEVTTEQVGIDGKSRRPAQTVGDDGLALAHVVEVKAVFSRAGHCETSLLPLYVLVSTGLPSGSSTLVRLCGLRRL